MSAQVHDVFGELPPADGPSHPAAADPLRRWHSLALGFQLLTVAGLLATATGLVVQTPVSPTLLLVGCMVGPLSWVAGRACARRAWSRRPAVSVLSGTSARIDRWFGAAAAALLTAAALAVSTLGPTGGFLAAAIGVAAVVTAVDRARRPVGHVRCAGRWLPLLLAAAVSWISAATLGGLGVNVLGAVSEVGMLGALLWAVGWCVRLGWRAAAPRTPLTPRASSPAGTL